MSTLRELRDQVEAHLRHGVDEARFLAHFRVILHKVLPLLWRALPPDEVLGTFPVLETAPQGAYFYVGSEVWAPVEHIVAAHLWVRGSEGDPWRLVPNVAAVEAETRLMERVRTWQASTWPPAEALPPARTGEFWYWRLGRVFYVPASTVSAWPDGGLLGRVHVWRVRVPEWDVVDPVIARFGPLLAVGVAQRVAASLGDTQAAAQYRADFVDLLQHTLMGISHELPRYVEDPRNVEAWA